MSGRKSDENREKALVATNSENCQKDEMWTKCQTCWETSEFEVGSFKTFWKIETANAIFWMYLGGTAKKKIFSNKTFLFFKIESWNFQVQFEI